MAEFISEGSAQADPYLPLKPGERLIATSRAAKPPPKPRKARKRPSPASAAPQAPMAPRATRRPPAKVVQILGADKCKHRLLNAELPLSPPEGSRRPRNELAPALGPREDCQAVCTAHPPLKTGGEDRPGCGYAWSELLTCAIPRRSCSEGRLETACQWGRAVQRWAGVELGWSGASLSEGGRRMTDREAMDAGLIPRAR